MGTASTFFLAKTQLQMERPTEDDRFEYPAIADAYPDPKMPSTRRSDPPALPDGDAESDTEKPTPKKRLAIVDGNLALPDLGAVALPP